MGIRNPAVDAYIEKSADFAKPILNHLRALVHEACPGVEEAIKWSFPNFMYHGVMCNMAAFKAHATFGFWKAKILLKNTKLKISEKAMGQFGTLTRLSDLPSDKILKDLIREAMLLNEKGVSVPKKKPLTASAVVVPSYLKSALSKNMKAKTYFESISPSQKREYIEWLEEAKSDVTRDKRLGTTLLWLSQNKNRNWKYESGK